MHIIDKSIHDLEKSIQLIDDIKKTVKENKPIKIEFKPVIKVDVQYDSPPKKENLDLRKNLDLRRNLDLRKNLDPKRKQKYLVFFNLVYF